MNGVASQAQFAGNRPLAPCHSGPEPESVEAAVPQVLADSPLFEGLDEEQLARVHAVVRHRHMYPGEFVFHAGDEPGELYVIATGAVEIVKDRHALLVRGPGDCIGEEALEDRAARAVSVRVLQECDLLCIPLHALRGLLAEDDLLAIQLRLNFSRQVARDFRALSDVTVQSLKEQLAISQTHERAELFVITMLVMLCVYVFVLQVGAQLIHGKLSTSWFSIPGFILFFALFYRVAKRSGQPWSAYGVTLQGWRRSLAEGLLYSLPLMALTVLAKWLLVTLHPAMAGEDVFVLPANLQSGSAWLLVEAALYIVFSPFQEFIVRGGMQGSLEQFLRGPRRVLNAILIANLMYAMLHLYMSVIFSIMVFLPGLTWGWLYARHRTLVGVTASHALCGVFAFFVVGFDTLIRIYG